MAALWCGCAEPTKRSIIGCVGKCATTLKIAAIKGDETLSNLASRYDVAANLIVKWKKQLLDSSSDVFASGTGLAPDRESEIKSLQAKIGEITMENDFLSKVLGR